MHQTHTNTNEQAELRQPFWGSHLNLFALLLTIAGIAIILVSQFGVSAERSTTLFVIGGTALFVAHIAAFGGLFILAISWVTRRLRRLFGQS